MQWGYKYHGSIHRSTFYIQQNRYKGLSNHIDCRWLTMNPEEVYPVIVLKVDNYFVQEQGKKKTQKTKQNTLDFAMRNLMGPALVYNCNIDEMVPYFYQVKITCNLT